MSTVRRLPVSYSCGAAAAKALLGRDGRRDGAGRTASGGDVAAESIVFDHAIGVESPAQRADSPLHELEPAARQAIAIALVIKRNHRVAQNAVEVLRVAAVMHTHVRVGAAGSDGESVQAVEGFRPPAVEYRKIQPAVEHHLLPARAGRFQGSPRIIEPDVNSLHEVAAHVD